MHTQH